MPALLKKSNTDWIVCQLVNQGKTITWKGQNGWKCYRLGSGRDSNAGAAREEIVAGVSVGVTRTGASIDARSHSD